MSIHRQRLDALLDALARLLAAYGGAAVSTPRPSVRRPSREVLNSIARIEYLRGQGCTFDDIGRELRLSADAVRMRWRRHGGGA